VLRPERSLLPPSGSTSHVPDQLHAASFPAAPTPAGFQQDPAAGSALFATPPAARRLPAGWLGRRLGSWLLPRSYQAAPLATFPLNLALTAEAAVSDPQLGPSYSQLLEEGLVGEREVVILMLLVERLRGSSSKWAPWIQQLPHRWGQEQALQLGLKQRAVIIPSTSCVPSCWCGCMPHPD
jgi:hypothetical protein